jgi:hypothetical protein
MAWCVRVEKHSPVTVLHGSGVEVGDSCFVEGAWDGPFEEMEFQKSFLLMGSGGKIVGDRLILASPCHTLEKLYTVQLENQIVASNSLVFVLAQANLELDLDYKRYLTDQKTIVRGLQRCVKTIPTRNGPPVKMHYFCNVKIDVQLGLCELPKTDPGEFHDFNSYYSFLTQALSNINHNANSAYRKQRYTLLTSISSGYDSPACSAIAAEAGCKEAVTFRKPTWGEGQTDSGTAIAKVLGLRIKEYSTDDYLHKDGIPEAEFIAAGDAGDVQMAAFENQIKDRVFVTGFHGDKMWDISNKKVGRDIQRGDNSGSSLGEYRLRVGFIHCPIPFFGCIAHPSIHDISGSEEMAPWKLGTKYDRPIARRIVEGKGVDRELFGQTKKAAATWWNFTPPKAQSAEAYYAFRRAHRTTPRFLYECIHRLLNRVTTIWTWCRNAVNWLLRKVGIGIQLPIFIWLLRRFYEPSDQDMLMQWGILVLSERYRQDTQPRVIFPATCRV